MEWFQLGWPEVAPAASTLADVFEGLRVAGPPPADPRRTVGS